MAAMLPDGRRISAHIPLAGRMIRAAERAAAIGASTNGAGVIDPSALMAGAARSTAREWIALPTLLILAALARLPDLATRGTWDADQGHDMLVLRALVRDGVIPLLGPPTSIGDVHHGAWYYFLLSPAAALTGGDSPLVVVGFIALAGITAVGVVWWLGRSIGGPLAGLVAGLTMAVSIAAIDESTFIWNPNLIALSSAVALAGTWRAWSGHDRRWWLVAALGTAITMQLHVLGIALLPIVAVPLLLDARRRSLRRVTIGIGAIYFVAYLPLIINEATTGFSETHAALDYLAGGRTTNEADVPVRFGIVGLRVISWPLTGLITQGFVAASLATVVVVVTAAWLARRPAPEQTAARWLGAGLLWTVAFLTVAAPSLATVVQGLPNDHYHAFADPLVFVLVGLGVAAIARRAAGPAWPVVIGLTGIALVAVLSWNLTRLPPAAAPDGGYPRAQASADRVEVALTGAGIAPAAVVRLASLPAFKSTEAMAYPLIRTGRPVVADVRDGVALGSTADGGNPVALVLLCDDLFRAAIGARCGGPAESAITPDAGGTVWGVLLDRFEAAPGRWVSVYGPAAT